MKEYDFDKYAENSRFLIDEYVFSMRVSLISVSDFLSILVERHISGRVFCSLKYYNLHLYIQIENLRIS